MGKCIVNGLCLALVASVGCGSSQDVSAGGAGAGGPSPIGPVAGGTGAAAAADFCGVSQVSAQKCQQCHAAAPLYGAPMPLVTHADFMRTRAEYLGPMATDPTRKVYEIIPERINATEAARQMPPITAQAQLLQSEKDLISAWVTAGAPNATTDCGAVPIDPGTTGMAGMSGTMDPPTMDPLLPPTEPDPMQIEDDVTCYDFKAHASGAIDAPYNLGFAQDTYIAFSFNSPWTGMKWLRSVKTKLDNKAVVHHWLLYRLPGPTSDGSVAPSAGAHPAAELVHGWAPGGTDLMLPDDVAMEAPQTGWLLEFHYNSSDPAAKDGSAVEVCVADNERPNVASISWLGTNSIGGISATGTCVPRQPQGDITILGFTPHMHTKGKHMKAVINRAGGAPEVLHDEPFDFNYQIAYEPPAPVVLHPGDTITTTCSYSSPASFGSGTNDEMCYFFVMYYPRLALTDGSLLGGFQSANTCFGGGFF